MIPRYIASRFERFMSSGRTSPALFGCEDASGSPMDEFVVKLRGSLRNGGLVRELLASRLATYFGLSTPAPALIVIEQELVDLVLTLSDISPSQVAAIRGSSGLNFGTRHLVGAGTWPTDKSIPESRRDSALEIFAFDALIQNPDRRFDNPNLFARLDEFIIFDHETAFSFLFDIGPATAPWEIDIHRYLVDHAFYRRLKSKEIELEGFISKLGTLSESALQRVVAEVPAEWENEECIPSIVRHVLDVCNHANEFAEAIRRILR
jgi:hypothetical protein